MKSILVHLHSKLTPKDSINDDDEVDYSKYVKVNVRRDHLLHDGLLVAAKKKFDPTKRMKVDASTILITFNGLFLFL